MKIATILPLKKGIFKENLTYFTSKDIKEGDIVEVPVRNKNLLGLVISIEDAENAKSNIKNLNFNLRKITEVKSKSLFQKEFFEAMFAMSDYTLQNKSVLASLLIPEIVKTEYDKISKIQPPNKNTKISHNLKIEKTALQSSLEDRVSYYKTLIRSAFADKKSIIIVLPTEKDINDFTILLGKGIEQFTINLHSGLTNKKILDGIKKVIESDHPLLILITPIFLSLPRHDISTIILELESSNNYKTFSKSPIDYRLFVELFAYSSGIKLIFGDTLLRMETILRIKNEEISETRPITYRLNWEGKIIVNNPTTLAKKEEAFKIFSPDSVSEIKRSMDKGEKIFIYTLRKGLATFTMCRDCSQVLLCKKCSAPIVLYLSKDKTKRMFVCNRCGESKDPNTICAFCGSWNLFPLGIGTDTVYGELEKILADDKIKILQIDKDKVKSKKEAEKIIEEFYNNKKSILLGTEMAFYYLRGKVATSVVASLDSLWSIPNFKISEKVLHVLLKILNITEKRVIIQTKNPTDEAISAMQNLNMNFFVNETLSDRKNLEFPPYKRFIKISYLGDKNTLSEVKNFIQKHLSAYEPEIFSGFVNKIRDKYMVNALIRIDPENWSLPMIKPGGHIDQELYKKLSEINQDFNIIVDPDDLL